MMYYKMIGDRQVFNDCRTIQTNEGIWLSNPTQEQIAAAGWIEYVAPAITQTPQTEPDLYDVMLAVKKMLAESTVELSDEDALSVAALYPTWSSKIGDTVNVGERYWYDGRLWKVIQTHTVQDNWTPDISVSLFTEVTIDEWPEWRQPTGSADAYMIGDKVSHNSKHWISTADANVWEPGIYGWEEQF